MRSRQDVFSHSQKKKKKKRESAKKNLIEIVAFSEKQNSIV